MRTIRKNEKFKIENLKSSTFFFPPPPTTNQKRKKLLIQIIRGYMSDKEDSPVDRKETKMEKGKK